MEKKSKRRKNPKLRLNKDSLRPVSEAALRGVVGGTGAGGTPCPTTSSDEPQATCVRISTCHTCPY